MYSLRSKKKEYKDRDKRKPTFSADFESNTLYRDLRNIAMELGAHIDGSGFDRSYKSSLSKTRHKKGNAVDISFEGNPSYFDTENNTLTSMGVEMVKRVRSKGYRVFLGDGHIHVDRYPVGEVDKHPAMYREGKKSKKLGPDNMWSQLQDIEKNINGPKSIEDLKKISEQKTKGTTIDDAVNELSQILKL